MDRAQDQNPQVKTLLPLSHLIALAALYAIVNLWFLQHTGQSVADLVLRGGIGVFALSFLASLEKLQKSTQQSLLNTAFQWLQRMLAKPTLIALLYGIALALFCLRSSITIVPSGGIQQLSIHTPTSEEPLNLSIGSNTKHQWLTINPFGSTFELQAPGYQPELVTVYPLFSTTLNPARDFTRSPTLYVRLDGGYARHLRLCKGKKKKCGTLAVLKNTGHTWCSLTNIRQKGTAFAVGWPRTPGADDISYWNLTYDAANLAANSDENQTTKNALKAKHLFGWLNPAIVNTVHFQPGEQFQLALYNHRQELQVNYQFTMPDTSLFDVFLTPAFSQGETPDEINHPIAACACTANSQC